VKAMNRTVEKFYTIDFKRSCVVQTSVSSIPRRNRPSPLMRLSLLHAFACYQYFGPAFWSELCAKFVNAVKEFEMCILDLVDTLVACLV
jgi:hypothetical protein